MSDPGGGPPATPPPLGGEPPETPPSPAGRHTLLALMDSVGGAAALVDSAAPTIVFALTYTLGARHLRPAVVAAVAVALVLAGYRLLRRQPVRTVATGFLGIALAAAVAVATGRASDYYLVSIIRALGLALLYAVSALVRWPVIGVVVGAAAGNPGGFRHDPEQLRAYTRVTWLWVALFLFRLAVRGPLLLANAFTWLSVTDVIMGWPLFLAWTGLTYVLLRRWLHGSVWEAAREGILARNARTAPAPDAGPGPDHSTERDGAVTSDGPREPHAAHQAGGPSRASGARKSGGASGAGGASDAGGARDRDEPDGPREQDGGR